MADFKLRRERTAQWLKAEGKGAGLLLTDPKTVYYLTGFYTDPHERFMGLFFDPEQGWTLLVPQLDFEAAQAAVGNMVAVCGYGDDQPAGQLVKDYLSRAGWNTIFVEENHMSYARAKWLLAQDGLKIHNISPFMEQLRMVKDEGEIVLLKEAARVTDQVLAAAMKQFKRGMTENDLVAELEYQAKKHGAAQMSFSTTVLSGKKSALPHGHSGAEPIGQGNLLIDFGLVINGYCSDITRTFHVGEWDQKMQRVYEIVLTAQQAALEGIKPGMTLAEADRLARKVIEQAGYGPYFIHRLGHGIGLNVHEHPSVAPGRQELVKPGMVFTVEPGIYLHGQGGVRIEDAVVITDGGAAPLTSFPKRPEQMIL
ncbi:peptidase M24 [Caldalkalibacillus thermarum TA2.A1]|uniref:Peptidase M24 n=1 Tax=Caldalkalibacillus thermarum (strain TA2.A1) TaxID=986075 RepID=F5L667_CALTT|nr:Xaa-Pro peptidase family protein [Caldalkalibacillus thermarum]EGL83167.1 peptidase M24 [Caldalkalibacillus thermarum TA2.A1]QZT35094.1 Xaa-Pro peptidase family protein [Caldalkalibacillus thermarum TA2.A1]